MRQLSCCHMSLHHDTKSNEFQHDELLEQIREDERADLLQQVREIEINVDQAEITRATIIERGGTTSTGRTVCPVAVTNPRTSMIIVRVMTLNTSPSKNLSNAQA